MITLDAATGDERCQLMIDGMRGNKFELSDLVAGEYRARQIIPLDPETFASAPSLGSPGQKLQRSWDLRQLQARWIVNQTQRQQTLTCPWAIQR